MKFTTLAIAGGVLLAGIHGARAEPIHQGTDLFAIIAARDGNNLTIRMINAPVSRDGENIIFANDLVLGTIEPLKTGNTRQAVCVTAIRGLHGNGQLIPASVNMAFPREGCLGQLHDYLGASGLLASDIAPGLPVRIFLNGDLIIVK